MIDESIVNHSHIPAMLIGHRIIGSRMKRSMILMVVMRMIVMVMTGDLVRLILYYKSLAVFY